MSPTRALSATSRFPASLPQPGAAGGYRGQSAGLLPLTLLNLMASGLSTSIQPGLVPQQSLPILQQIPFPPEYHPLLLMVNSLPSSRSSIKVLNRTAPNTDPRGMPFPCTLGPAISQFLSQPKMPLANCGLQLLQEMPWERVSKAFPHPPGGAPGHGRRSGGPGRTCPPKADWLALMPWLSHTCHDMTLRMICWAPGTG